MFAPSMYLPSGPGPWAVVHLIGPCAAGKTTLSRAIVDDLQREYPAARWIDFDLHAQRHVPYVYETAEPGALSPDFVNAYNLEQFARSLLRDWEQAEIAVFESWKWGEELSLLFRDVPAFRILVTSAPRTLAARRAARVRAGKHPGRSDWENDAPIDLTWDTTTRPEHGPVLERVRAFLEAVPE